MVCDFYGNIARTGEDPTRVSIGFDATGNATIGEPVDDPLRVGQIINEEIDATVQGYRAQINHAVFVGNASTPGYDYYRAGMEIAVNLINEVPTYISPGKTTLGDFVRRYKSRLDELGGEDVSGVMFHSERHWQPVASALSDRQWYRGVRNRADAGDDL